MNIASAEELYPLYKSCRQVSTDTRTIGEGDLFFALKGPSFNGNRYAAEAIEKGAVAAVIDEPQYKLSDKFHLTGNALEALQQLAAYHRTMLNIPVIAIAGSNGKTTTKELVKAVLETSFTVFATPGNLNNEIGVPLTLLRLTEKTQVAVVEMGARQRGDIRFLCHIAAPSHGLITNTGKDHLETFKTLENTRKTNAELYEHLASADGVAFVNAADADLLQEAGIVKKTVTYGKEEHAACRGRIESFYPLLSVSFLSEGIWKKLNSQLTGKYNFENIMAAAAIGKHFGVSDENIIRAVESYRPLNNRSQLLQKDGNTYILDAYNANPPA